MPKPKTLPRVTEADLAKTPTNNLEEFGLTPRQDTFVRNYVVTGNATKSAAKAGYSPKVCHTKGYTLLKEARVKEAIAYLKELENTRLTLTRQWIAHKIEDLINMAQEDRDLNAFAKGISLAMDLTGARMQNEENKETTVQVMHLFGKEVEF